MLCARIVRATIRPWRDDADHVSDVMAKLSADGQQLRSVVRAGYDAIAAELAAENVDLSFQETDSGVASGGACLGKEVRQSVEPSKHRI
jgi:hypothetical protein